MIQCVFHEVGRIVLREIHGGIQTEEIRDASRINKSYFSFFFEYKLDQGDMQSSSCSLIVIMYQNLVLNLKVPGFSCEAGRS